MKTSHVLASMAITSTLFIGAFSPVFAESATPTPSVSPLPSPSPRTRGQIVRQEKQTLREEKRTDIAERRASKLQLHCDFLNTKFTTIFDKIQVRIDRQNSRGRDTSAAAADLAQAKTDLPLAVSACTDAVTAFNAITPANWSTQKPEFIAARLKAKASHDAFMKVWNDVHNAILALVKVAGTK